jgi:hypothetical protein
MFLPGGRRDRRDGAATRTLTKPQETDKEIEMQLASSRHQSTETMNELRALNARFIHNFVTNDVASHDAILHPRFINICLRDSAGIARPISNTGQPPSIRK